MAHIQFASFTQRFRNLESGPKIRDAKTPTQSTYPSKTIQLSTYNRNQDDGI